MGPPPKPGKTPRFSLGRLMGIVAICAGNLAMFGVFARTSARLDQATLVGVAVIVGLYDLLIYFSIAAVRRLVKPPGDARPTLMVIVIAALVLSTCAGFPLAFLALAFWKDRR